MSELPFPCLEGVPLAGYTTIRLGGPARFFSPCRTLEQARECLFWARARRLRVHILGGGSNVVFSDRGFDGAVIQVALSGVSVREVGAWALVEAAAGEPWDALVELCVDRGFSGIECLSGIPGTVGAVPIQNVGAYGQEAAETIEHVKALRLDSLGEARFSKQDCAFGYRQSRFKSRDAGRYLVTTVTFRLRKGGASAIRYPELAARLRSSGDPCPKAVREAVLAIRRKKSMLIDPADPESVSVGSFFLNPLMTREAFQELETLWRRSGAQEGVPAFPAADRVKVPAAWLVERSGFTKGYRRGGVGVSANHALALVNRGGSAQELLALAEEIRAKVLERFGVRLELEPVVVE